MEIDRVINITGEELFEMLYNHFNRIGVIADGEIIYRVKSVPALTLKNKFLIVEVKNRSKKN